MEFILAAPEYLEDMCRITDQGKAQLKRMGLDQWQKGYPNRQVWEDDIQKGITWLAMENGKVMGAFAFLTAPEPAYAVIDGAWLTDGAYASIHRFCVADECKGQGVAGQMFHHGATLAQNLGFPSVRIDTHPGNLPMQRALEKAGFIRCGKIHLMGGTEDGDLRYAYELILTGKA